MLFTLDDDLNKKLKVLQANYIQKTGKNVSFSRTINYVLQKSFNL